MNNSNLKPFKRGESGNPNGRPPKLINAISELPKEAQNELYSTLYNAISLSNIKEAEEYLKSLSGGKYGFVLQIALKELLSPNGWQALNDILNRLFGRPKQAIEQTSIVELPSIDLSIVGGE